MSRLLIKNLPSYVTPTRLREHFEQKGNPGGTLTDLKVASKRDGTSRRFGFVGYKTEQEASAAKEWFDKTFIDSSRISVNVIEGARDAPSPRPNKRPRLGPVMTDHDIMSDNVKMPTAKKNGEPATAKPDSQLDVFMELMQPRTKKGPLWANEVYTEPSIPPQSQSEARDDLGPVNDTPVRDETISDLDWMKRRIANSVDVQEKVFDQSDDEDRQGKPDTTADVRQNSPEPKNATVETLLQTARLFIRNLAFSCTDGDLVELFKPFGQLSQVHIPIDSVTKQSKGVAYVTFTKAADAVTAYEALDRKSFQGRLIHILAAIDLKREGNTEDSSGQKGAVKKQKQADRKATAGKEFNWSMLYMNSDAVASSIADRLGVDKASILNPEFGDNAAVKLALAETHIIQETKTYLESQGVILSSFTSRKRSDTVILVKNIPYGTTSDQIRELFEPHGELCRVLVPPAGTMAVVEFDKPDEAAKAFRAVAYRRLGNSIIYLEKGPLGMFIEGGIPTPSTHPMPHAPVTDDAEQTTGDAVDGNEEPTISGGSTLYVKNLAFSTTQERFTKMFHHLPSFSFARIQTKPDPKHPNGPRLSMGYGFLGFKDVADAKKALTSVQGFVLDGHQLQVKFAGRGTEEESKGETITKSSSRTTKMIVKNVPFEATKKDIRALFGSHGHLKSVRLPKKFDSRTRGFAFLDFVSRAEAENAFAALRHTHLLGRHLVLEWAEEAEQDIEILRKKAGVGYGDGKLMPGRKRKLDLGKTGEEDVEDLEV